MQVAMGFLLGATLDACGSEPSVPEQAAQIRSPVIGSSAYGTIPTGLPPRMLVGLFEGPGGTWLRDSGVKWDARYQYFTKGWVNNWGFGQRDGSWGLTYFQQTDAQGMIPVVQYYQIVGEPGGGESAMLSKVQNAGTMSGYFGDFKILMQRIRDFNKPVVVLMEADGFAFLQQQSKSNPDTYAAVADSGLSELSGLPNTVAGWGLAFLQLRKSVGATTAILGIHVSAWLNSDIAYGSTSVDLGTEVDIGLRFLNPLGLGSNVTGATWDLLVGDPLDRDSDYYRIVRAQDRWWDPSDTAPINSKSFNRYAEWLRLFNQRSGKRWVLWQIPCGNSNLLNVKNNGNPREGYKDNRPEYFFLSGAAHRAKFADVGVIALLFGRGAGDQSNYANDQYTDGLLFLKTHVGSALATEDFSLAPGANYVPYTPPVGTGGTGGGGGSGGSGGTTASGGSAPVGSLLYDFESGEQGWHVTAGNIATGALSVTDLSYEGQRALAVSLSGPGKGTAQVETPPVAAGANVAFHVWIPAGSNITAVQPFALEGASANWAWHGKWTDVGELQVGAWNEILLNVPVTSSTLFAIGVEFTSSGGDVKVYVDAVGLPGVAVGSGGQGGTGQGGAVGSGGTLSGSGGSTTLAGGTSSNAGGGNSGNPQASQSNPSGCLCRAAGGREPNGLLWIGVVCGLALACARRRRRVRADAGSFQVISEP
jgi:hypothetical protein